MGGLLRFLLGGVLGGVLGFFISQRRRRADQKTAAERRPATGQPAAGQADHATWQPGRRSMPPLVIEHEEAGAETEAESETEPLLPARHRYVEPQTVELEPGRESERGYEFSEPDLGPMDPVVPAEHDVELAGAAPEGAAPEAVEEPEAAAFAETPLITWPPVRDTEELSSHDLGASAGWSSSPRWDIETIDTESWELIGEESGAEAAPAEEASAEEPPAEAATGEEAPVVEALVADLSVAEARAAQEPAAEEPAADGPPLVFEPAAALEAPPAGQGDAHTTPSAAELEAAVFGFGTPSDADATPAQRVITAEELRARIEESRRRIRRELEEPFSNRPGQPAAEVAPESQPDETDLGTNGADILSFPAVTGDDVAAWDEKPPFEVQSADESFFEELGVRIEGVDFAVSPKAPKAADLRARLDIARTASDDVLHPSPSELETSLSYDAMRARIEETRNRLKAKADDAAKGDASYDLDQPAPTDDAGQPLDGLDDIEAQIERMLREEGD